MSEEQHQVQLKDEVRQQAEQQQKQLRKLWSAVLADCIRYMETTSPENIGASRLEVIRAFLKDNNISMNGGALADIKGGLSKLQGLELPFH